MKNIGKNNIEVFKGVIKSLSADAIVEIDGASLADPRRFKKSVIEVEFHENDKVSVRLPIVIELGFNVPTTVAAVQDKVKSEIEKTTRFIVNSIDVEVVSVSVPQ